MKIECSECQKLYNIPDERLPVGKVGCFNCKNCGTKIRLDLRKSNPGKEKSDDIKLTKSFSSPVQKQDNNPGENSLKEKILKKQTEKLCSCLTAQDLIWIEDAKLILFQKFQHTNVMVAQMIVLLIKFRF